MFLLGCLCYIEVLLKLQLKCLILGVYTCFYLVGNWHIEAFQEIEEEEDTILNILVFGIEYIIFVCLGVYSCFLKIISFLCVVD